ncbi:MAG: glycosyltransferase family 4 protein [Acidobacteria bacterium]|nr:glycosyltransferase family 4 protein [Acidobacteriota bacterium]
MRILTFTKLYPNEQMPLHGIFVARRVTALAHDHGHQVEVIAPVPYFPKFLPAGGEWQKLQQVPRYEERNGVSVYHPRYFNPPKIGMTRYGTWMAQGSISTVAARLQNGFPFDVIDAHFVYPDGLAAVQIGRKLNRPVVVTARGSDVTRNKHLPQIRPLLGEVMRSAAQLIAVSEELRDDFIELGAAPEKIHVIPNGIDPEIFSPMPREVACQQLGLNPKDRWLVSVGRLDHNKGQWVILEALQKIGLKELQRRQIKLALIGQGEDREKLEQVSRSFGLNDIVHFAGQLNPEKICIWYNAAEVKILASLREGSPNVVLEALACGTPVVASRAGRNEVVIREKEHGLLFPLANADALQTVILQALDHQWNRQQIALYGRQRNWTTVAREVESVLRLAIKNNTNPK